MRLFDDRDFRSVDARAADAPIVSGGTSGPSGKASAPPARHDELGRQARNGILARIKYSYEISALYFGWFVFGSICLTASFIAGFLRYVLPRKFGARFGQRMITTGFKLFMGYLALTRLVKCDVRALDQLKHERGLILAPNHPSLIDAVLVISRLPRVTCIMKAVLWDNIVLGGGSRLAGFVRNDSQPNMVRASVAALRDGGQLLMFPEGTRTVEQPINPLKGAIALIAKKSQAPVQTILIESNTDFLGKHWPTLKKPTFPLYYRATLGKRFDPPCDDKIAENKAFVAELDAYFRTALLDPSRMPLPPN
jgi:1-acyl-sn-glycerol-3-phosphate acyltransferase